MNRGFTLIEIMIVIGIITILASLIIPGAVRSRTAAVETTALSNLKTASNACQLYYINMSTYPSDLVTLSGASPPYIDAQLGSGQKQNYQFVYTRPTSDAFTLNANPVFSVLFLGRFFYTDETGIIRVKSGSAAGPGDTIVQ